MIGQTFTAFRGSVIFNATANRSGMHMVFSNNNPSRALHWRGYFIRTAVVGMAAFVLLTLFWRPGSAGVSVSPEVCLLSGDQAVLVTARFFPNLPVVVDLVELSDPTRSTRQPDQTS